MRRTRPATVPALVFLALVPAMVGGLALSDGGERVRATVLPTVLPPGFVDEFVADVASPTGVEMLPDGRLVVLEQAGRLRAGQPGAPLDVIGQVPDTCLGQERGLLGLAASPGYLTDRHVYLYATRQAPGEPGGCVNRVSRFDLPAALDPTSEAVLLDRISSINGNHNAGDLEFGSDGFLYVSTGDAGRDPRGITGSGGANAAARDLSHLSGKILRVTSDGAPAPGNPLAGPGTERCAFRGATAATPTTSCQELFSWGLRNPYRFAFDPNGGGDRFFVNDVGQVTAEEVNEGGIGLDYGWNVCEGPCPPGEGDGLTDPIAWYPRSVGTFITAGAFVPDGIWPEEYDGSYLFADGGAGEIFRMDAAGAVDFDAPFAEVGPSLADMVFAFDEQGRPALYYTLNSAGELRRIVWTGAGPSPTPADLAFEPVPPTRAYDTRAGLGADAGRIRAATTRLVDLDLPSPAVRAALVNITVTDNAGWGFLQAWTPRSLQPDTSVVNVVAPGEDVANTAVVALDEEGRFVVHATTATHLVVDVLGWFSETDGAVSAGRYVPVDPGRLVDTRRAAGSGLPSGAPNAFDRDGDRVETVVAGELGVPDDGAAAAAVVVLTALGEQGPRSGFVTAFAAGGDAPDASNVNTNGSGDIRANLAVVPLGLDGAIALDLVRVDHALVDVVGYVTSDLAPAGTSGRFSAVAPVRLYDERAPSTPPIPAGGSTTVGHAGAVPGAGGAAAVLQNLTITETTGFDFATAVPGGGPGGEEPEVSNVNATAPGQTRAALAVTPYGPDATITYSLFGDSSLVVDVVGTFSG